MHTWVIGIDEAGRGPLAGPVAVGIACVAKGFDWSLIPGVGDSKKVSPKNREVIFRLAIRLQKEGLLTYSVGMSSAKTIDQKGIVPSINKAMRLALLKIHKSGLCKGEFEVLLDGGLKAPSQYKHQKTIIKGDSKEKVIGLASIMAKVTRDRYMTRQAKLAEYKAYDFGTHKGYGTKAHREAIAKNGLSKEHRATFCGNIPTCKNI